MHVTSAARAAPGGRVTGWVAIACMPVAMSALLRAYDLLALPIFLDEAIHISWARGGDGGGAAAASHGRWLAIKLMSLLLHLPLDALVAARLLSVMSAVVTTVALVACGRLLFDWSAGIAAACLYAVVPFVVFHDRMALTDSLQTALGALLLLAALRHARAPSVPRAALMAMFLPAAILAKESSVILIPIPVIAALLLARPDQRVGTLIRTTPAVLAALALFALLVRRGYAWQFTEKTQASGIGERLDLAEANVRSILDWYWIMLTPPIALLAVGALVWLGVVRHRREHLLLIIVLGLAVLPYVVSASTLFPRYLHFSSVPLALLGGQALSLLAGALAATARRMRSTDAELQHACLAALLIGFSVWPLRADLTIVSAPERATLPAIDRGQYVTGWPAGYGTREAAAFIEAQARSSGQSITVARLHYEDQAKQGVDFYLERSEAIAVVTFDPGQPNWLAEVEQLAGTRETLFVLSPARDSQAYDALLRAFAGSERVWQGKRPGGEVGLEIWRVARSGTATQ